MFYDAHTVLADILYILYLHLAVQRDYDCLITQVLLNPTF